MTFCCSDCLLAEEYDGGWISDGSVHIPRLTMAAFRYQLYKGCFSRLCKEDSINSVSSFHPRIHPIGSKCLFLFLILSDSKPRNCTQNVRSIAFVLLQGWIPSGVHLTFDSRISVKFAPSTSWGVRYAGIILD